jgi:hypothetical protein
VGPANAHCLSPQQQGCLTVSQMPKAFLPLTSSERCVMSPVTFRHHSNTTQKWTDPPGYNPLVKPHSQAHLTPSRRTTSHRPLAHFPLPAWFAASARHQPPSLPSGPHRTQQESRNSPLLVASSSSGISTAFAGRWTYLTTEPRIKTFLTALYRTPDSHRQ